MGNCNAQQDANLSLYICALIHSQAALISLFNTEGF